MSRQTQEINFMDLIAPYLRMWWLIVLFVSIGAGSAYFMTEHLMVPYYEAKTIMFIGKDTDVLSGISMSDLQIDNKLVLDYRELIKTKLVIEQVTEELNLNRSYESMVERLDVNTQFDSRFINVVYVDSNPERAATVVNKFSETLVVTAQDIVGVDNIQIVDYADPPKYPSGPSLMVNGILAVMVSLLTAILIIFIIDKTDNRLKTKKDVEDIIGLTVLSEIPKAKGGSK